MRSRPAGRALRRAGCEGIPLQRHGALRRHGKRNRIANQTPQPGRPLADGDAVVVRMIGRA